MFVKACDRAGISNKPDFNTAKGTLGSSEVWSNSMSLEFLLTIRPLINWDHLRPVSLFNVSCQFTILPIIKVTFIDSRARRASTESAYLTPDVLARPNLRVATGARVTRIVFDDQTPGHNNKTVARVVGVQFQDTKGDIFEAKARREVVVS